MKKMGMRMLLLMMMAFGLTDEEHDGSDASGNDSGSYSSDSESDFAGSSDSDGQATKRKRNSKHSKKKNKHSKKKIAKKQKRTIRKNQNRATRAEASAAPAAASANDGYLLRRLRHRRRSPLRAVGSAARVVQAIGGTRLGSRRSANLVGAYASQREETRHQRLPIRE